MALDKITTNIIEDDAITAAKIVAGAVEVDIRAGSVTGDKIGYLGDGTGNLSGTIANQQLHFGTAFTLTDNLTVNGDVTLGKVGDDGTGQSLTQNTSANRTITGTGTLRMGSSMSGRGRLGSGVTFPPGHVVNVTNRISGTRVVMSNAATHVMETISVNKTIAGSTFVITGTVSAAGDHSGFIQQGWKYGSGTEVLAQSTIYGAGVYAKTIGTHAVITGHTTTGAQDLVFRFYSQGGATNDRPFLTYNPNGTDSVNMGQSNSIFTIFEVLT